MLRRAVAEKARLLFSRAAAADCAAITQLRPAVAGSLLAAAQLPIPSTAPGQRAGFVSSTASFAASDDNTMVFYPEPEVRRQLAAGMVRQGPRRAAGVAGVGSRVDDYCPWCRPTLPALRGSPMILLLPLLLQAEVGGEAPGFSLSGAI